MLADSRRAQSSHAEAVGCARVLQAVGWTPRGKLLAMAWADGQVSTRALLRNWIVVCAANAAGAAGLALLAWWSGHGGLNGGAVGQAVIRIALAKLELPPAEAFFRGVLCNLLAAWRSG